MLGCRSTRPKKRTATEECQSGRMRNVLLYREGDDMCIGRQSIIACFYLGIYLLGTSNNFCPLSLPSFHDMLQTYFHLSKWHKCFIAPTDKNVRKRSGYMNCLFTFIVNNWQLQAIFGMLNKSKSVAYYIMLTFSTPNKPSYK